MVIEELSLTIFDCVRTGSCAAEQPVRQRNAMHNRSSKRETRGVRGGGDDGH